MGNVLQTCCPDGFSIDSNPNWNVVESVQNDLNLLTKPLLFTIKSFHDKVDEKARVEAVQEDAESGLRLKKLEELEAMNQRLKSLAKDDFKTFVTDLERLIKQIRGTEDNVITKANKIVRIFNDTRCPLSISIATFAKKMVSVPQDPFARSYVIVYVTSQFPQAIDILLAELHKACVFPKHVETISGPPWYQLKDYYERIDSTMRLYGALVQTNICGSTNIHGIKNGWAWLNRFLDDISNNDIASATALNGFLQTAGCGLYRSDKSRFMRVMNVLRDGFLAKEDSSGLRVVIINITVYLDYQMHLEEPEGRTMKTNV